VKNRRLEFAILRRQPAPAIVPFLSDSFDRCDPTRSRESKPSVRMREARHTRRIWRPFFRFVLAVIALAALLSSFN
jgi:hypothetical protein